MANEQLVSALMTRERDYVDKIELLREMAPAELEDKVHSLTRDLKEAVEMVRCLRRLLPNASVSAIHHAFGAPGDFGYETPIGDALARLYRGEP